MTASELLEEARQMLPAAFADIISRTTASNRSFTWLRGRYCRREMTPYFVDQHGFMTVGTGAGENS
jgi:hypothetical protein